jgi:hypothetical protein
MGRRLVGVLLTIALVGFLLNCGDHKLTSLKVTPDTATTAVGQNAQFHAICTTILVSNKPRTPTTQDLTNQVSWSSDNTAVATINSSGVAQSVAPGSATITASSGSLRASAVLSVGGAGGTGNLGSLTAITIIPSSQTTSVQGEPAQYIAIGTLSGGSAVAA